MRPIGRVVPWFLVVIFRHPHAGPSDGHRIHRLRTLRQSKPVFAAHPVSHASTLRCTAQHHWQQKRCSLAHLCRVTPLARSERQHPSPWQVRLWWADGRAHIMLRRNTGVSLAILRSQRRRRKGLARHVHFAPPTLERIGRMLTEILLRPLLAAHRAAHRAGEIFHRHTLFDAGLGVGDQALYDDQLDHGIFLHGSGLAAAAPRPGQTEG